MFWSCEGMEENLQGVLELTFPWDRRWEVLRSEWWRSWNMGVPPQNVAPLQTLRNLAVQALEPWGFLTEPVFFGGAGGGPRLLFLCVPGTVPELVFQPGDFTCFVGQMPPFTPPCLAQAENRR